MSEPTKRTAWTCDDCGMGYPCECRAEPSPHPEWGPCDGFGPDGACSECTGSIAKGGPSAAPPDALAAIRARHANDAPWAERNHYAAASVLFADRAALLAEVERLTTEAAEFRAWMAGKRGVEDFYAEREAKFAALRERDALAARLAAANAAPLAQLIEWHAYYYGGSSADGAYEQDLAECIATALRSAGGAALRTTTREDTTHE